MEKDIKAKHIMQYRATIRIRRSPMGSYRLIWFQHMHKVAGTTIVELADVNGEVLYPEHKNGNPHENGERLKLGRYSEDRLMGFLDNCEKRGITFVATEWGAPIFSLLEKDPRVELITCLRDPLGRFVSNFNYDLFNGHTEKRSFKDYANSSSVSFFNYYCRMLSGAVNEGNDRELTEKDLDRAKKNLSRFDHVLIMEESDHFDIFKRRMGWKKDLDDAPPMVEKDPLTIRLFSRLLGWKGDQGKKKRTQNNPYIAMGLLKRANLILLLKYIRNSKMRPDADFKRYFHEANRMDEELYDLAKRISVN